MHSKMFYVITNNSGNSSNYPVEHNYVLFCLWKPQAHRNYIVYLSLKIKYWNADGVTIILLFVYVYTDTLIAAFNGKHHLLNDYIIKLSLIKIILVLLV